MYVLQYSMPRAGRTEVEFASLDAMLTYLREHPGVPQKAERLEVFVRLDASKVLAAL